MARHRKGPEKDNKRSLKDFDFHVLAPLPLRGTRTVFFHRDVHPSPSSLLPPAAKSDGQRPEIVKKLTSPSLSRELSLSLSCVGA